MKLYITGGGTGGHVTPGIAIARACLQREPDSEIRFAGTEKGIESKLVPRENFPLDTVDIIGLSRKLNPAGVAHNLSAAKKALTSVGQAKKLLRKASPDCVVGCGGYVSFPVVYAAQQMGIPTVLLEVNALPGKTTKMLAKHADKVLICFEQARALLGNGENIFLTGAPVRREIALADRAKARKKLGIAEDEDYVISFWGSMGALYMNRKMAGAMALECKKNVPYRHLHATGSAAYPWMPHAVEAAGGDLAAHPNLQLTEYIYDMADQLAAADLVLCRAGAATLGELSALGRASLLVPSPFVAENHQEKNARAMEQAGASRVLLEADATPETLVEQVEQLLADKEQLQRMHLAAAKNASADAGAQIYAHIRSAIDERAGKGSFKK